MSSVSVDVGYEMSSFIMRYRISIIYFLTYSMLSPQVEAFSFTRMIEFHEPEGILKGFLPYQSTRQVTELQWRGPFLPLLLLLSVSSLQPSISTHSSNTRQTTWWPLQVTKQYCRNHMIL
jgi:hypothetical protein